MVHQLNWLDERMIWVYFNCEWQTLFSSSEKWAIVTLLRWLHWKPPPSWICLTRGWCERFWQKFHPLFPFFHLPLILFFVVIPDFSELCGSGQFFWFPLSFPFYGATLLDISFWLDMELEAESDNLRQAGLWRRGSFGMAGEGADVSKPTNQKVSTNKKVKSQ